MIGKTVAIIILGLSGAYHLYLAGKFSAGKKVVYKGKEAVASSILDAILCLGTTLALLVGW